jgi:hypothetical protein
MTKTNPQRHKAALAGCAALAAMAVLLALGFVCQFAADKLGQAFEAVERYAFRVLAP